MPASVLLREILQRGYDGGYSMLHAFLRPMKQPITEEVTRFKTEPGFQMQVAFTIIRLGHNPLLAFVATLGSSRSVLQQPELSCLVTTLRPSSLSAMSTAPASIAGTHQLMHIADKYAFTHKACRPYRSRTKGKVERFNHYLKNSFIVPLTATFRQAGLVLDVPAAYARIGEWLVTVANTQHYCRYRR